MNIKKLVSIVQILIAIMTLFGMILYIKGQIDSAIYVAVFTVYGELLIGRVKE